MGSKRGSFLLLLGVALSTGACSTVRTTDTGNRGLFQKRDEMPPSSVVGTTMNPERSDHGFSWPVKEGRVSSFFGKRRRDYHEGLDIRANRGSPIYAAKNGEVIYSSKKIRGYGNMIVIKHDDGMATVYAHNRKNLVKRGERVNQGQLVGYVGATGKATGPHLHFEIRKGELPQDPLLYLPQIRSPAMANK